MLGRRGEKELSMIFGLFILLIITLVILSVFLEATGRINVIGEKVNEEAVKQARNGAILECEQSCAQIRSESSAVEFCKKTIELDWDGNKLTFGEKGDFGLYEFCEEKIPCFILADSCEKGRYDGNYCKNLLSRSDAVYNQLVADAGAFGSTATIEGGCGLDNPPSTANPDRSTNWRIRYGFCADDNPDCEVP